MINMNNVLLLYTICPLLFLLLFSFFQNGTGDANDVWKILITNGKDGDIVETVTSKLKFVHYLHHCVLTCSGKTLPKWSVRIVETI